MSFDGAFGAHAGDNLHVIAWIFAGLAQKKFFSLNLAIYLVLPGASFGIGRRTAFLLILECSGINEINVAKRSG